MYAFANKIAAEKKRTIPFPGIGYSFFYKEETDDSSFSDKTENTRKHNQILFSNLDLLGLAEMPTSPKDIQKAYRIKISQYHPDKFSQERPEIIEVAQEMSKNINAAYSFLKKEANQDRV